MPLGLGFLQGHVAGWAWGTACLHWAWGGAGEMEWRVVTVSP